MALSLVQKCNITFGREGEGEREGREGEREREGEGEKEREREEREGEGRVREIIKQQIHCLSLSFSHDATFMQVKSDAAAAGKNLPSLANDQLKTLWTIRRRRGGDDRDS